ncbi:MAG: L,D-transpeptidase [Candidatus Levybacteria bacterium]|nr:L,D-transpeptidase [Candidatus Levybacteria bacterium]
MNRKLLLITGSFSAVILLAVFFSSLSGISKIKQTKEICANSISCIKDLTGKFESKSSGEFMGKKVQSPSEKNDPLVPLFANTYVLGDTTAQKRIEVNLSTQHLYAFEGNKVVYDFLISSGKWYPTPTGTFNIWVKLRYTRMSGGDPAIGTYYNLPNVPFVMFYYNNEIAKSRGFSLHGTYWHNNFGHPMSHGCINMRTDQAEKIYYWSKPSSLGSTTYAKANEGTKIIVYGTAPIE